MAAALVRGLEQSCTNGPGQVNGVYARIRPVGAQHRPRAQLRRSPPICNSDEAGKGAPVKPSHLRELSRNRDSPPRSREGRPPTLLTRNHPAGRGPNIRARRNTGDDSPLVAHALPLADIITAGGCAYQAGKCGKGIDVGANGAEGVCMASNQGPNRNTKNDQRHHPIRGSAPPPRRCVLDASGRLS